MANTIDTMTPEEILRGIIDGSLTELEDENVTFLRDRKLSNMTELGKVSLPSAVTWTQPSTYSIANCSKLTLLRLFNLSSIRKIISEQNTFAANGSASYPLIAVFPSLTLSNGGARLLTGSYMDAVDFGEAFNIIYGDTFYGGTFRDVILRNPNSVVAASSGDAILKLTTALGNTIYIRKALYDHLGDGSELDYKAATNWSAKERTYACIEGSEYENFYADGTPITQMGGVITSSILAILLGAQLLRREVAING